MRDLSLPRPRALFPVLFACTVLIGCEPEPDPDPKPEWQRVFEGDDSFGALLSVWGPSLDDVYSVGGNPEAGRMIHYDGTKWSDVELPEGFPLANWVYGVDGDILWIAGAQGQVARRDADGSWTTMALERSEDLWGIWGSSDNDMYTVGGTVVVGEGPLLAHYDGSAWTELELPELDRPCDSIFKVWGTSSDNVFAVGRSGVVLHYDGTSWEQQLAGTSSDLISLWGTGPDEIVAVGGRSNGVIARWDGSSWSSETTTLPGLNGVWVDGEGTAYANGVDGVYVEIAAGGFEFTEFYREARPEVLHGSFGFDDGTLLGVGGSLLFSPPWSGLIVQYVQP